jgi:NAD-dependent SIR2 family protein deacetylase
MMEFVKIDGNMKQLSCVNSSWTYASYILIINQKEFPLCVNCLVSCREDLNKILLDMEGKV